MMSLKAKTKRFLSEVCHLNCLDMALLVRFFPRQSLIFYSSITRCINYFRHQFNLEYYVSRSNLLLYYATAAHIKLIKIRLVKCMRYLCGFNRLNLRRSLIAFTNKVNRCGLSNPIQYSLRCLSLFENNARSLHSGSS